jgi:hypothetical protein
MAGLAQLQCEVDARVRRGEPFSRIEHDLIEPSDLCEEDKSALWLYGWASLDDGPLGYQQRRVAVLR